MERNGPICKMSAGGKLPKTAYPAAPRASKAAPLSPMNKAPIRRRWVSGAARTAWVISSAPAPGCAAHNTKAPSASTVTPGWYMWPGVVRLTRLRASSR